MDERALALRIAAAESRGDEQRAGHIGSRNPEDHRLQVPGAQQIARKHRRQVDAVEVAGLGAVVRDAAADQVLAQGTAGPATTMNFSVAAWAGVIGAGPH